MHSQYTATWTGILAIGTSVTAFGQLAPSQDNRNANVSAATMNNDPLEDQFSIDPSEFFEPVDRTLSVSSGSPETDLATARVVTRSEYVGYIPAENAFNEINFSSDVSASLQVGFEAGSVSARDSVSMGFEIAGLAPGETVPLHVVANVKSTGTWSAAIIRLTGPGINLPITSQYEHVISVGNGSYILTGTAEVSLAGSPETIDSGSVELTASVGGLGDVIVPDVLAGPFRRGNKAYYLLDNATWERAHLAATACLGGDLVTYNDATEAAWVRSNVVEFDGLIRHSWTGYSDRFQEGQYGWANGEGAGYVSWLPSEPNSGLGEYYAAMWNGTTAYFDAANDWNERFAPVYGVVEVPIPNVIAGPFFRNGSRYYLLDNADWLRAEAAARALGGNLVDVNDADEAVWLRSNVAEFDGVERHVWIGLTDKGDEGTYTWTSGADLLSTRWISGEPNGGVGQNHVAIFRGTTQWFDAQHDWNELFAPVFGIAEIRGLVDGCACEFDGQPDVLIGDLLGFLSFWFAGDAGADLDGDGMTDINDLLGFLACWFEANNGGVCP